MAAMSPKEVLTAWENAYLDQCQTARVGSLFRGTIHNLNGVVQAFSMQSELFAMMFVKADRLLEEALCTVQDDNARDKITQVRELMQKRQRTLEQVEEKILLSQDILKNNDDIRHKYKKGGSSATLHSLIEDVVSFFNSHMFFKHKVKKNVSVNADLPLGEKAFAISVVLANILENSIQAMEQNSDVDPCFAIRSFMKNDKVIIEIEDNGIGVPEDIRGALFQEFVSATPGHHGLGLYQAKKLVSDMGGEIEITRLAHPTIFTINMPMNLGKE
ncbi:MAG: ATP-binding protein [Thermodesulfobacteriota bacterium]